jgi:hypothetical protein
MPKILPNTTKPEVKLPVFKGVKPTQGNIVHVIADEDTQTSVITKHVMSAFDKFASGAFATMEANEQHTKAQESERGIRERLMVNLAELSAKDAWKEGAIADACKQAVEKWSDGKNRLPTTLAQFSVECRRAMHPAACEHVKTAFDTSREAWNAERVTVEEARVTAKNDGTKFVKPATPLSDAFGKRYHMVAGSKGMLQAYIDAATKKNPVVTANDAATPEALASVHEQTERQDPRKAARTLAKIVSALEAIYAEFPAQDISDMLEYARDIDAKALEEAKAEAIRAAKKAAKRTLVREPVARSKRNASTTATDATTTDDAIDDLISE